MDEYIFRVVAQLLAELDGINKSAVVFVIGATNRLVFFKDVTKRKKLNSKPFPTDPIW